MIRVWPMFRTTVGVRRALPHSRNSERSPSSGTSHTPTAGELRRRKHTPGAPAGQAHAREAAGLVAAEVGFGAALPSKGSIRQLP